MLGSFRIVVENSEMFFRPVDFSGRKHANRNARCGLFLPLRQEGLALARLLFGLPSITVFLPKLGIELG
jgi:hypothetical protein